MNLNYKEIINILEYVEKSEYKEIILETDDIVIKASKENLLESTTDQEIENKNSIDGLIEEPSEISLVKDKSKDTKTVSLVKENEIDDKEELQTSISIDKKDYNDKSQNENYIEVLAPMMGTFYRAPSPSEPPYINVGDEVNEDTPVGLIEVMKLFNTIPANVSGKVIEILVEDGQIVEQNQPLLIIDQENN